MSAADFWNIIEQASALGGGRVHLAPGAPAMLRQGRGALTPLREEPFSAEDLVRALSLIVDPERWPVLEQAGSGEASAFSPSGHIVRLSLFRGSNGWVVVAEVG